MFSISFERFLNMYWRDFLHTVKKDRPSSATHSPLGLETKHLCGMWQHCLGGCSLEESKTPQKNKQTWHKEKPFPWKCGLVSQQFEIQES